MKTLSIALVATSLALGCASKTKPDETKTVEQSVEKTESTTPHGNTGQHQHGEGHHGEGHDGDGHHGEGHHGEGHHGEGHDGEEHGHQHRGHRFDQPEKYAKRWNDPARNAWQKPKELIALMGVEKGMTVADIGTGTGYLVPFLAEAVGPKGKVWALDIEPKMVEFVNELAAEKGLKNVEAKKVTPDGPGVTGVDRFVTVNTWHHIGDREAYSAKIAAALNDGGSIAVVDYAPDADLSHGPPKKMRLDPKTVIAELEAGGLSAELADESLPRQYVVIGRKK